MSDKLIKLHLGCGPVNFGKSWVHIDGGDYPHVTRKSIERLPYFDNTIDIIYASHVLEYFDKIEVIDVLREWHRVLKPTGVLRLSVPNFTALSYIYNKTGDLNQILGPLYGRMKMGENIIYHKTVYDYKSLTDVLRSVGFSSFCMWNWQTTKPHDKIDDVSAAYWPHDPKRIKSRKFHKNQIHISLNIEAIK